MVDSGYPQHWEADVVLRDGGTAHLRPIRPDDAARLLRFYARLSDETIYFRFFSLYRKLSDRDVERFTVVDHADRVALVATVRDEMIGVVRYERTAADEAEVAFNIEDAHQGRGLGSVFLEHIAAAARERGISRFVADVLPTNRRMLRVFEDAGFVVGHEYEDGVLRLEFGLEPTEDSLAVTHDREHRSESRSVWRLLRPRAVAVVGAGRAESSVGRHVLRHLREGGYTGELYAVNPATHEVEGVTSFPSVAAVPGDIDLVVLAVPADQVDAVVADCVARDVQGLLVLSAGFAETGEQGRVRQQRLVSSARAGGMRVIGPSSFGVVHTHPDVRMNASLAPEMPPRGRIGFFSQSGALAVALLDNVVRRGMGITTFVSAGNRVDVSGNDLMQYWEDDTDTDAVLLYLESIGNPRKFTRVARRLSRRKPVVVVKSGRSRSVPHGHLVRASRAPAEAIDALFRQAGVIRVDNIHQMFDVGQLVAHQPLPGGDRVAVVGNSDALGVLAADACEEAGLVLAEPPRQLGPAASAEDFAAALADVLASDGVDSVVALFIPPLVTRDEDVARVLAEAAGRSGKTVVASFLGMRGVPDALAIPDRTSSVPSYPTPEDAVRALAAAVQYARWRATPAGHTVSPSGLEVGRARDLVAAVLGPAPGGAAAAAAGGGRGEPVPLCDEELSRLLACYGVEVTGPEQASEEPAVACVLETLEDPLFGPVVSFGLAGVASELLGDRAYRIPPLTDLDVREMVRSIGAFPLLQGHGGGPVADVDALERLVTRVARMADDLPELSRLVLDPVLAGEQGLTVAGASALLARPQARGDRGPRALPG